MRNLRSRSKQKRKIGIMPGLVRICRQMQRNNQQQKTLTTEKLYFPAFSEKILFSTMNLY